MRTTSTLLVVVMSASLASVTGCKPKEEPNTPASVSADTAPAENLDGKDPSQAGINIGPKIAELCGIEATNFKYNSASLSKQAKTTLDALAQCFIDGPAVGKSMRIVGHADPRGDEEYNLGLGQRRADNVTGYLTKRGLEAARVESSSRGEMDATGTDESSWSADRRVDIMLAE
ncbi:MAG: OmpA family protein [Myxococcales bacterium]|nr:OmpA family protein [Myxococcales bacterium]